MLAVGRGWAEANGALAIHAHDRILLRPAREKADTPSMSMSKGRGGVGGEHRIWIAEM